MIKCFKRTASKFSGDLFLFHINFDLCSMEINQFEVLARIVLSSEIQDYFNIVS